MKKLLSIILITVICLSLCFCFVGCNNIFSGNYKFVADEDINSALMGLEAQPSYGSMNGLYLNLELKSKDLTMKATLKYLDIEKLFSFKMNMKGSAEGISLDTYMEAYHDGEYFYSKAKALGVEAKTKMKDENTQMLSGLMDNFDIVGQIDSEEFANLFNFDIETLKGLKTKVYVDDIEGTKIKMVFSQTEGNFNAKGQAFFVFDALKVFKAMKINMTVYEDGNATIIKMEMREFNGKITLPKGISDWEETELNEFI